MLTAVSRSQSNLAARRSRAEPWRREVVTQTEHEQPWEVVGNKSDLEELCLELQMENQELQTALEQACSELAQHRARDGVGRVIGSDSSRPPSLSRLIQDFPLPVEVVPFALGYMVLRTPLHQERLRGHHRVSWPALLRRLGLAPDSPRPGYYIRLFTSEAEADELWIKQRLALPYPVDPR